MAAIGWIGNFLLATCSIPLAYDAWRRKGSDVSGWFLGMWGAGELLALLYAFSLEGGNPLILNYIVNLAGIAVVARYRLWPGE